jgi:hypothetical protein
MAKTTSKKLTREEQEEMLHILKKRFESNMKRHKGLVWASIQTQLTSKPEKLWSLQAMEATGGEPDVIAFDKKTNEYIFCDCSAESPAGRRSLCYDDEALQARKENKPKGSALQLATTMGIELLDESEYRSLQKVGPFDAKTSSWIKTPQSIRALGGGLFCDYRYGQVFTYHNGAESYYAARGFRGLLRV